nr:ABC transporter [Actinomycetota bacterium]
LQNEFLQLQTEIRKTIVFVTHDIDEAIKLGDRIAILGAGSRIAQYDDPETVLTAPADGFVEDFIGAGASLKRLNLTRLRDVKLMDWPVSSLSESRDSIREALLRSDKGSVILLDPERRPARWVNAMDLDRTDTPLAEAGLPADDALEQEATLYDALNEMLSTFQGASPVVDSEGVYLGVIDIDTIAAAIKSMRAEARQRYRGKEGERLTEKPVAAS